MVFSSAYISNTKCITKVLQVFTKVSSHGRLVYGSFGSLKGSSFETKPIIKNTEHIWVKWNYNMVNKPGIEMVWIFINNSFCQVK